MNKLLIISTSLAPLGDFSPSRLRSFFGPKDGQNMLDECFGRWEKARRPQYATNEKDKSHEWMAVCPWPSVKNNTTKCPTETGHANQCFVHCTDEGRV